MDLEAKRLLQTRELGEKRLHQERGLELRKTDVRAELARENLEQFLKDNFFSETDDIPRYERKIELLPDHYEKFRMTFGELKAIEVDKFSEGNKSIVRVLSQKVQDTISDLSQSEVGYPG